MKQSKKNQEMKVYGRNASLTLFKKRPEDIIRAYVTQDGVFEFKELIRYCANKKLAYHIVEKEELETITKAIHHEGIALVVKNKKLPDLKDLISTKGRVLILALEEVENPHNLGAIMRTAAHYGVTGIIYQAKVPVAQTASAYRTSEGGAESVPAVQVTEWGQVLDLCKSKGVKAFSTSSHSGKSLFETKFPDKTILFMGAEGAGLSKRFLQGLEGISIPGTGEVESLNVSNATAAILTEWYRQGQ